MRDALFHSRVSELLNDLDSEAAKGVTFDHGAFRIYDEQGGWELVNVSYDPGTNLHYTYEDNA